MVRVHGRWGHYFRPDHPEFMHTGYKPSSIASSNTSPKPKKSSKKKRTIKPGVIKDGTFGVLAANGMHLYTCKSSKKEKRARAFIETVLPKESYKRVPNGFRLTTELPDLGFSSRNEFIQSCALGQRVGSPADTNARAQGERSTLLSKRQLRKLDAATRVHGLDLSWMGWDVIIAGWGGKALIDEAARLGFDKPDDSTWIKEEDSIFYKNCRRLPPDSAQWKKLLPRKSSQCVAQRYLATPGLKATRNTPIAKPARMSETERSEKRVSREVQTIDRFYNLFGWEWDQWRRIIPWLTQQQIKQRAIELGHTDPWTENNKLAFIRNDCPNWTLFELNILIEKYPRVVCDSHDWAMILPQRSRGERDELAELLDIPTPEEVRRIALDASELM